MRGTAIIAGGVVLVIVSYFKGHADGMNTCPDIDITAKLDSIEATKAPLSDSLSYWKRMAQDIRASVHKPTPLRADEAITALGSPDLDSLRNIYLHRPD